jgi:hypothetical protein
MIVFVVRLACTLSNQCLVQKVFSKRKESSAGRSTKEEKGRDMRKKSNRGRTTLSMEEASLISFFFCSFYCPIWTETAEYTLHGFSYCLYNELTAATIVDNDSIY